MNYEGFEEKGDLLNAFIPAPRFDQPGLNDFASNFNLQFSIERIEHKNWNEEWEKSFQPVIIQKGGELVSFAGIRAAFHEPLKNVEHEIIITPRMSFGTGHHPTTAMMIRMMSELPFESRAVLDFGTGTGILAILSAKLGASTVVAIDCDDQSIENATANFKSNNSENISLLKASSATFDSVFDIILANLTKQLILDNLPAFATALKDGGVVLLSGLLQEHVDEVEMIGISNHLYLEKKCESDRWICLEMRYKSGIN